MSGYTNTGTQQRRGNWNEGRGGNGQEERQGFNHEQLNVYHIALDCTTRALNLAQGVDAAHDRTVESFVNASLKIAPYLARSGGHRGFTERKRALTTTITSALECAVLLDILSASGGISAQQAESAKEPLQAIVAMTHKMRSRIDEPKTVGEEAEAYKAA